MTLTQRAFAIALAASLGLASGCGPAGTPGVEKSASMSLSIYNVPVDDKLDDCTDRSVDHHFEIKLTPSKDQLLVSTLLAEYDMDIQGNISNYKLVDPSTYVWNSLTPMNIPAGLDGSARKAVAVHVMLMDVSQTEQTTWYFPDGTTGGQHPMAVHLGVTSREPPNKKIMFCRLDSGAKSFDFRIAYKPVGGGPDGKTHAFYNINVVVPVAGQLKIPVTFDPEVKNEG
jgi:hypothetical protein